MEDQSPEILSPVDIFQIVCNIREGTADPNDACRLMRLFCYFVDKEIKPTKELFGYQPDYRPDELVPKELLWHFRDAFEAILDEGKTPESALGLARREGRPAKYNLDIAKELVRLRINGDTYLNAVADISIKLNLGETTIRQAWREYWFQACFEIRNECDNDNSWKPGGKKLLADIFNKRKEMC